MPIPKEKESELTGADTDHFFFILHFFIRNFPREEGEKSFQQNRLLNSLLGILLRFRRERIAMTMDVEHMFCNFKVP